jgi:hypothetical protein
MLYYISLLSSKPVVDPFTDIILITNSSEIFSALIKMWYVGIKPIIAICIFYIIVNIKIAKCNLQQKE